MVGPQTGIGVAARRPEGKVQTERALARLVERNEEFVGGPHVAIGLHRVLEVARVGPAPPRGRLAGGKALEDRQARTAELLARLPTLVEPPKRLDERDDEGLPRANNNEPWGVSEVRGFGFPTAMGGAKEG